MKAQKGEWRQSSTLSLTSVLDVPAVLPPGKRHSIHFIEGWVGPRACLNVRRVSPPPGFDSLPFSAQRVAISKDYTDHKTSPVCCTLQHSPVLPSLSVTAAFSSILSDDVPIPRLLAIFHKVINFLR